MTAHAHTFHGANERVFEPDDLLLDSDPLLGAIVADERTGNDWESGEGDFMNVEDWLSITFQRWHRYQRDCQAIQRVLCWTLLIEYTYRGLS